MTGADTLGLAIIGAGKMGRAVEQLAQERGWRLVAIVEQVNNASGTAIRAGALDGADVAIEFTEPGSAPANVRACVAAGCPVVVGTTGWYDGFPTIRAEVEAAGAGMLYAPNFSVGVHIFAQLVALAARLSSSVPGFERHLLETHHAAKKDAPSGTALMLADIARDVSGAAVPVTSVRVGSVPGTHEAPVVDGAFEQIRLVHEARDRRVFADGALVAARWLVGRRGVFTMADVLSGGSSGRD